MSSRQIISFGLYGTFWSPKNRSSQTTAKMYSQINQLSHTPSLPHSPDGRSVWSPHGANACQLHSIFSSEMTSQFLTIKKTVVNVAGTLHDCVGWHYVRHMRYNNNTNNEWICKAQDKWSSDAFHHCAGIESFQLLCKCLNWAGRQSQSCW